MNIHFINSKGNEISKSFSSESYSFPKMLKIKYCSMRVSSISHFGERTKTESIRKQSTG